MGAVWWILKVLTTIYDVITYPVYLILQRPGVTLSINEEDKSRIICHDKDSLTVTGVLPISHLHGEFRRKKMDTLDKVFALSIMRNRSKKCFGTREVIKEEFEEQPNGKMFKKLVLGSYKWKTYEEVDVIAAYLATGLEHIGLKAKNHIAIFAETREEFMMTAMAAFRLNLTMVTVYATLGDAAVAHALNETECEYVITSHELLPKFKTILQMCEKVKHIIYMEDPLHKTETEGFKAGVEINSFDDLVALGSRRKRRESLVKDLDNNNSERPSTNDVAIIMYTSGSTGTPKGVLLTHGNITSSTASFSDALGPVYPEDIYIGFLPLAHVLELMCETICFAYGIPIGYSTPLTLTDTSSKIRRGAKGDASELRPTIMASVPLILDRMYKAINAKVQLSKTAEVFHFFYDYKLKWVAKGFQTPLVDKIIFRKIRKGVGGKLRLLACGGAPLCSDTQEFVRTCLCVPVLQGYGLTETSGAVTASGVGDMTSGRIGGPLTCCEVRLVNWDEGNYKITDKPYPRGELIVGGHNVSIGYYKLPEKTAEDFIMIDGQRMFKTGDIVELHDDGSFKIIDRKKDLVKLQQGEYISLGKVEAEMRNCLYIENICVYADSTRLCTVALIVPTQKPLENLAAKMGMSTESWSDLCKNKKLTNAIYQEIVRHGGKCGLHKFEIPGAITLVKDMWTPKNELVTAAFKLKRKNIQNFYQNEIDQMYQKLSK